METLVLMGAEFKKGTYGTFQNECEKYVNETLVEEFGDTAATLIIEQVGTQVKSSIKTMCDMMVESAKDINEDQMVHAVASAIINFKDGFLTEILAIKRNLGI